MPLNTLLLIFCAVAVIGVSAIVLLLLIRFVRAHERAADALEVIARKTKDAAGGN